MGSIRTFKQGAGVSDHGALTGLTEDDHVQYTLIDGSRGFISTVSGVSPIEGYHLVTKDYVDGVVISGVGVTHGNLSGLDADDHTQYLTEARGDARYYQQAEIDAISGSLSAEIDADITTHAASADHDGRYYTETELDNGQLDDRYYTESEVNTISGALSAEIDGDITTHAASADHDGRYYTETELDAGQLDDRYYTETEVDTISGSLNDKISAVGGVDEIEYITVDATDISNKYTVLAQTPYDAAEVALDIVGGCAQIYDTDYTVVSGTHLSWSGLSLDGVIAADDNIRVFYTYTL